MEVEAMSISNYLEDTLNRCAKEIIRTVPFGDWSHQVATDHYASLPLSITKTFSYDHFFVHVTECYLHVNRINSSPPVFIAYLCSTHKDKSWGPRRADFMYDGLIERGHLIPDKHAFYVRVEALLRENGHIKQRDRIVGSSWKERKT